MTIIHYICHMSFTQLFYHIIFSTKNRRQLIRPGIERDVYSLIYHISRKDGVGVFRIGGMPDHVHMLVSIPADIAVATYVKNLKRQASLAIRQAGLISGWDGWQNGYGCFSYSFKDLSMIRHYIVNQKEHHKAVSFRDEYRALLIEAGVSPDEPYFPK